MNRVIQNGALVFTISLGSVAFGQFCDPAASFDEPLAFEAPFLSNAVALGDLNNDGILDAVIPESGFDMLDVLLGDGSGSFGPAASFPAGTDPRLVALGDLDGDGNLDAAVTSLEDGTVSVLLGNGDGTLADRSVYATAGRPLHVTLGDVDGDGDLDVLVSNGDARGFDVLKNAGDGTLGAPRTRSGEFFLGTISLGDLDGDGDLDVVAPGERRVLVSTNDGEGNFGPFETLPAPVAITNAGTVDMDGDGDLDIVGIDASDDVEFDVVVVFRNNGDATFDATEASIEGIGTIFEFRDMDGDGDTDVVTADVDIVHVLLNGGDGNLASAGRYASNFPERPEISGVFGLAVGDVDDDGDADAVTIRSRTGMGSVLANRGDGTLSSPIRVPFTSADIRASDLVVADLDNDGSQDLVIASPDSQRPRVYFFEAPGAYVPAPELSALGGRSSIVEADFNGDGLLDLVAAGEGGFLNLLLNRGDRTFDIQPRFIVRSDLLEAGDLNGDGLTDVVASDGRFITVVLGDGAGDLTELAEFNSRLSALDMKLADVDRNGSLDLLFASFNGVFVLANDGAGMLAEPTLVLDTDDPEEIALGDVNGDGLDDLVVFRFREVTVLFADAGGGFMVDRRYVVDSDSGELITGTVADLNGDLDADIVLTLEDGQTAAMLNNGDGSFSPPQVILADFLASSHLAVADIDGDGTNDVVTTDFSFSRNAIEATILLNRCRPAECPVDLDSDGELTVFDFLAFFNLFDAGSARADFDGDGELTIFDFLAFQNEFDAGCP